MNGDRFTRLTRSFPTEAVGAITPSSLIDLPRVTRGFLCQFAEFAEFAAFAGCLGFLAGAWWCVGAAPAAGVVVVAASFVRTTAHGSVLRGLSGSCLVMA